MIVRPRGTETIRAVSWYVLQSVIYSALQMKLQSVILLSICSVQIVAFLGKPVVTNGHSMVTVLVLCTRLTVSACIAETQSK